jgi:hypothetical protein
VRLLAGTVVSSRHLHCATVVRPSEGGCQVLHEDQLAVVKYSAPFKPRAERLTPGQLVAIASTPEGSQVVVWRWFDAVVLEDSGGPGSPVGAGTRRGSGTAAQLAAAIPAGEPGLLISRFAGGRLVGGRPGRSCRERRGRA